MSARSSPMMIFGQRGPDNAASENGATGCSRGTDAQCGRVEASGITWSSARPLSMATSISATAIKSFWLFTGAPPADPVVKITMPDKRCQAPR
jgi:hypothetical protein